MAAQENVSTKESLEKEAIGNKISSISQDSITLSISGLQNNSVIHNIPNLTTTVSQNIIDLPLMSKLRIIWNFAVVNLTYFLLFTGFFGLGDLQSTMNAKKGIGGYSQEILYGASAISSLFFPDVLIKKFGSKYVMVATTYLAIPYFASNMYLRWELLLPSSALFGLCFGPYICANTLYISELATRYQQLNKQGAEFIVAVFFGISIGFMELSKIVGNLISYLVLKPKGTLLLRAEDYNVPHNCGIHFQQDESSTNLNLSPPSDFERYLLVGIYVAMGILSAFLVSLLLDPLQNDKEECSGCKMACKHFLTSLKHITKPLQALLVPITLYLGIQSVLYSFVMTQAYIACSWGVHHVGFVTICFGVCGALMSLLVGPLVKCVSQMAVLILAALANISICVLLFLWDPSPETTSIYFIIAGVWGMGDAIWWSQITALYGLMFPNNREAAFSNLYFWSFLGFFLSYAYANYLSVAVKINILIAFLLAGMLGYLVGQIKIKCTARKEYVVIEDGQ